MDKNREIKFRAWDKTNKRMMIFDDFWHCDEYQSLAWKIAESSKVDTEGGYCLDWDTENLELMQFTGLLDKNGKEIYEGDIVKERYGKPFQVIYDVNGTDDYYYYYCGFNISKQYPCEIIGNVHENPKLLAERAKDEK